MVKTLWHLFLFNTVLICWEIYLMVWYTDKPLLYYAMWYLASAPSGYFTAWASGVNMVCVCHSGALGVQTEPLGPIKPPPLGRTLGREPESTTTPNTFPTNPSPALQGMSVPLLGSVLVGDGSTLPMVRNFFQPGIVFCWLHGLHFRERDLLF